jgi:predicted SprT family Zn-dependent metalloprotease
MPKDYKVCPRDRLELQRSAEKLRGILQEGANSGFDVVNYARTLAQKEILKTGKLNIQFYKASSKDSPAYVTYNPTTLHVDYVTWQEADGGVPDARFIIAHELGHIVLHDHYAQPFSGIKKDWIQFDQESAEWQANVFAEYFLISDVELKTYMSLFELGMHCSVDKSVATRRVQAKYKACGYSCPECRADSVIQIGITQKCFECGWAVSL